MEFQQHIIVGIGELLWNWLPAGAQLGGAPANFAYHATTPGNRGIVASRIGLDAYGAEAVALLAEHGLDASYVQHDAVHPTGGVEVAIVTNNLMR